MNDGSFTDSRVLVEIFIMIFSRFPLWFTSWLCHTESLLTSLSLSVLICKAMIGTTLL